MAPSAYTLKMADINKLLIAAPTFRDRCIIKTLFWLGLRRQELIDLDIRDIDFDRRRVQVRTGKGNKTRVIPIINEEYLSDLKHLIGPRIEGPIFTSTQGAAGKLSPRIINHIVTKTGELARVDNPNPRLRHLNPHILRHSISRWLKQQQFPAEWIQNFLGHESYKTTMDMYGTISIDEMQELASQKLSE